MKLSEGIVVALTGIGLVIIVGLITAFPTKWLWNWLMPVIFDLPKITFWQALGLNLLSSLLLKSANSNSSSK